MKKRVLVQALLLDKEAFVNCQFYQTDAGLAPLRKMPRYKELMLHYFPGKIAWVVEAGSRGDFSRVFHEAFGKTPGEWRN